MKSAVFLTALQVLFTFMMYAFTIIVMGISICPGALLIHTIWVNTTEMVLWQRALYLSMGAAAGYFIYGFTLILLVGILRIVFRLNLHEGEYRIGSAGAVKWAFVNSLFLIVSITFMNFILLTPFCTLFYRFMGGRLGKNVQINSRNVADISLLEIGDNSVIGGNATVICHSFQRRSLVLKKVKIGKGVTVGLNSVIMPGVEIGDGAVIAASAVLLKNTKVEPRSVYAGNPAVSARDRK